MFHVAVDGVQPVCMVLSHEAPQRRLTLAVAQSRCVGDVAANARTHAAMVATIPSRVVVFPELSLTGYELEAEAIATDDPRLAPIVMACAITGSIALVGAPVRGHGRDLHIGMLAIDGDGARVAYRKMYLHGLEADRFRPGDRSAVLEVDGWRLGLAICRDTAVPEHAANTARAGIDIYVGAILEPSQPADVVAERARRVAVDHGVWVAFASFAGGTGGGYASTAGGSGIWDPGGHEAARASAAEGSVAVATLERVER
jgi:predicted amidohydrolase